MTDIHVPLPSPGVGARRKGPKSLPRLPLSAFSPPNSGTSEIFPLPPSPSTIHPAAVVDGCVSASQGSLDAWQPSVGRHAPRTIDAVVLALPADSQQAAIDRFVQTHPAVKTLSVVAPVDLAQGPPAHVPAFAADVAVALSVPFVKNSPQLVEGVKWALEEGYVVDIDVRAPADAHGAGWAGLEELLAAVTGAEENGSRPVPRGAIVLSNILPPPHDLNVSIVKLLNHPAYRAYQSDTASLSLFPAVFVKYIPPHWGAPTPTTPKAASGDEAEAQRDDKERTEWKRRIKMYLGPAVEAFGFQRIVYGSSTVAPGSDSSDWYEIARESLAELGIDQDGVDAVFGANARAVYGV